MKSILSLFLAVWLMLPLFSQQHTPEPLEGLKVLSWNVFMLPNGLPGKLTRSGQLDRSDSIIKVFNESDYDVLVLQEVFHKKVHKKFKEELKAEFPYMWSPPFKEKVLKVNSGLMFCSRIPFTKLDSVEFENCSGIDCRGRKGATLIELEKNGIVYQIMNTHLNSGSKQKKRDVRILQYNQLYSQIIQKHEKDGIIQLLCGDFNTRKREWKYYEKMLECFDAEDGEFSTKIKLTYDDLNNDLIPSDVEVSQLDYILLRRNNTTIKHTDRQVKIFRANWHKKNENKDLSDHYAVEIFVAPVNNTIAKKESIVLEEMVD